MIHRQTYLSISFFIHPTPSVDIGNNYTRAENYKDKNYNYLLSPFTWTTVVSMNSIKKMHHGILESIEIIPG
jgi:hypothetical protein